jgi:hypothetical protein
LDIYFVLFDILNIFKVMADLLEGSSKHLIQQQHSTSSNSSSGTTPSLSHQQQQSIAISSGSGGGFDAFGGGGGNIPPVVTAIPSLPRSSTDLSGSGGGGGIFASLGSTPGGGLTLADQEVIGELNKANEVWAAIGGVMSPSGGAFTVTKTASSILDDLAPTESNLRRLIATANSIRSFRVLDKNDQLQILRRK